MTKVQQLAKTNTTAPIQGPSTQKQGLQFADARPEADRLTQLKEKANPLQRKSNRTGLPDQLKQGVESLSGYSMDDVKVHYNSSKPAQLQAHAYAQGNQIHLGPGQEKHLPHEAWHVVQQKQGRVRPTMQLKGKIQVNDDAGLEREADVMGEKAKSLFKTSNSTFSPSLNGEAISQRQPIQLKLKVDEAPIESEYIDGLYVERSPIINGIHSLKIPGMIESDMEYVVDNAKMLHNAMKGYCKFDKHVKQEILHLRTEEDYGNIHGRHRSLPPMMGKVEITEERMSDARSKEEAEFQKNLDDDIEKSSVYYRQLHAVANRLKGKDYNVGGLRPASVLDHVELHTRVKRDGKAEEEIDAMQFFEHHPRLINIIHGDSHRFIRDQFMQAIDAEGNNVILQNPNMSINPEKNGESVDKFKANEMALENILKQVKGTLVPEMKEVLFEKGDFTNTQNSFGNFMGLPPSKSSETGHLIIGSDEKGQLSPSQLAIANKFISKIVVINTAWLRVGHTDEVLSAIPWKNSEFGFKVLVADQKIVKHKSVDAYVTEILDEIAEQLIAELGHENVVRVPGLYVPYRYSNHYEKNVFGSLGGPNPEDQKYVSAYPNMVNMAVLNDHPLKGMERDENPFFDGSEDFEGKVTLVVPDPEADKGAYAFGGEEAKAEFIKIVQESGHEIKFENDVELHKDGGDIHCGTFELREGNHR